MIKKLFNRLKRNNISPKYYKKYDFGEIFLSFGLQHIHRQFSNTDAGFLAMFASFEFLHNLNWFINELNYVFNQHIILAPARTAMGITKLSKIKYMQTNGTFDEMLSFVWYQKRIDMLRSGKIEVRPEVYNYIMNNKDNEQKLIIEKQAAEEIINIFETQNNIFQLLEIGCLPK